MPIRLNIEHAKPEEIARGLKAAKEVFEHSGVPAREAAAAQFIVEGWDIQGFPGAAPEIDPAFFRGDPDAMNNLSPEQEAQCFRGPDECAVDPEVKAALEIHHVWYDAEEAAVQAACAGWPEEKMPRAACLEYFKPRPQRVWDSLILWCLNRIDSCVEAFRKVIPGGKSLNTPV